MATGVKWSADAPGRKALSEARKAKASSPAFTTRTHGVAGTLSYNSWKKMMSRCYKPANPDFKNYGGRGIKVCERWHNAAAFVEDMGQRVVGLSLERVNVNGNYEPGNCCWIPMGLQAKNRTNWKHTPEGLQRIAEAQRKRRATE